MTTKRTAGSPGAARRRRRAGRQGAWPLRDAKARLSEVVRRAEGEGPQYVTTHGRDAAVVVSPEEFRRLKGDRTGAALVSAMRASPHREIEIAPPRARMPVRSVKL
ncbi:MAG TPA: type II toxin-antitoxin system Phd/YefM family antitoxin [Polyangia bacterium]|jgi:prevent-host-death family protein